MVRYDDEWTDTKHLSSIGLMTYLGDSLTHADECIFDRIPLNKWFDIFMVVSKIRVS